MKPIEKKGKIKTKDVAENMAGKKGNHLDLDG